MIETILITAVSVAWFLAGFCAGRLKSTEKYIKGYKDGYEVTKKQLRMYYAGRTDGYFAIKEALKEKQDD